MECPKCHRIIDDNQTVCPFCHKVILLECPNCHELGESAICENCGFTILTKCSKCSKINPVTAEKCSKCGFPVNTSLAYQECESDEFAAIIVKFNNIKGIKKLLKSKELCAKFEYKLKNLLTPYFKDFDGKIINYGDSYVINFNKELSFATSANKAVRLALKIVNTFSELNLNIIDEMSIPLSLNLTIVKKIAEELQLNKKFDSNIKMLSMKKGYPKYLKGTQIILDEYVCDEIHKDFNTDSLFSSEDNGKTIMYYEIVLPKYVLPPDSSHDDNLTQVSKVNIEKKSSDTEEESMQPAFKVFDIKAKCSFEVASALNLEAKLKELDFKSKKIISVRSKSAKRAEISSIENAFKSCDYNVLRVTCTQKTSFTSWGLFTDIFKAYFKLAFHNDFSNFKNIDETYAEQFKPLFNLCFQNPIKSHTPEDARFAYMDFWNKFFATLNNTVIIIDGFEYIDDTSIETLEVYFDKYKNIKPNFVFITEESVSAHSKIPLLLRTTTYTEFMLKRVSMDNCISSLKSDAADFINSFYFEKIKENFNGSYLYFKNAVKYLEETGVLIEFENKLITNDKKSIVLPQRLNDLYKARIKNLSKNQDLALVLAYSVMLSPMLDEGTISALGCENVNNTFKELVETGLADYTTRGICINNYNEFYNVIDSSMKKDAEIYLAKNVLAKIGKGLDDTTKSILLGRLELYKEEYLTLWKNSGFNIKAGDYDAYFKNCLGFLSLIGKISLKIPQDEIEENKKDVYNNILTYLYSYAPEKIYYIEQILLMDAISQNDNEKIVKLSNMMLQGALLSSNYTDALGLLHNILSRMENPTLLVDGAVNTKFLLLSLVHIEILYNIGHFKTCIEISEEILSILSPEIIDKVKPAAFSYELFVNHLLDTFRLTAFAKILLNDFDLEDFLSKLQTAINADLPDKDALIATRDCILTGNYETGNIERYPAFSKVLLLILQELTNKETDYKRFAQNIYQAKLLAIDIHQKEPETFCDLMIAYAYSKIAETEKKAESIYTDVMEKSDRAAKFSLLLLSKYLLAKLKMDQNSDKETVLLLINDSLALIQKQNNQAKIFYAMFEDLYIQASKKYNLDNINIENEEKKILELKSEMAGIFRQAAKN